MAFIYEVNGQRVEFEKEPTEADIDEAARSLRPAPKSQQQRPIEGAGGAAFGVYRPQGRRPESQQDREASKEMPIQTARGVVTGMLGAPSDLANLPGNLYGMATGQPSPYQVPLGSEQWNQMLPFQSDTPQAKLARFGGEAMAPFPTVKGLKAVPGVVKGAGDVVGGAVGTGTGYIAKPGRTPQGYQVASERNPIGSTYTPPEEFAKFERGELPYGQMPEQQPIANLPQNALDRAALMLSGGNIPNAGQGARAFGERLGETYRNPLTAAADIGSMFFTGGVPVLTSLRGGLAAAQALADMRLANKGFTPGLPKQLAEYQSGVRPMPGTPGPMPGPISPQAAVQEVVASPPPVANLPQLGYTPGAGSPTMYVSPEGVASTNMRAADQGGIAQKYPPLSGPVAPQTPAIVAQQAAVEKITPPTNPVQAAAQETIAQKAQRVMGDKYRAPVGEQPIAGPVAPVDLPPPPVAAAPRVETPVNTPVLKGTEMKKEYPLTTDPKDYNKATNRWTDDYYSPETGKYMSPEERRWRNEMAANEISSTTESRQVGIEGKGKKAKPVMGDVKITSYDPASWKNNIQPDISWTSMVKENSIGREPYPTFILKGTKDGVDYTLKLNKQSAHMGDLYADINGKPTLVKQWYNDYSERSPKDWDKVQGKLGIDLEKISHPNPAHTDARGFEPEKTTKKKVASNDAMEMKTNPQTTFIDKTDFEKQKMVDTLAGEPTLGSYIDNGRLHEFELNRDFASTPKALQKYVGPEVRERITDIATGKIIKGEPPALTMREKLEADKKKKGK